MNNEVNWTWCPPPIVSVGIAAARLEAFIAACAGENDEYPIGLHARDDAALAEVCLLLNNLTTALRQAGMKMEYDPADLPPPPIDAEGTK